MLKCIDVPIKWVFALWGGIIGLFTGVEAILLPCLYLITVDFVLGIITDIKASHKRGERFGIQSGKLWKTIMKVVGVSVAVIITKLYTDSYIDWIGVDLGKLTAGIIAGTEVYSILGHLVYITDWYGFRIVKNVIRKEIETKVGHKIDEE